MGIGHIFEIDDRYTNIDRWSIIGDNYLLNVFTEYIYSKSQEYVWQKQIKDIKKNKIVSYKNTHATFFSFAVAPVI